MASRAKLVRSCLNSSLLQREEAHSAGEFCCSNEKVLLNPPFTKGEVREASKFLRRLLSNWPFVESRQVWRISVAIFVSWLVAPALAHAHGMGPEEIGPPIVTSGLLGFAGYWVVMLWPSTKKKDDQGIGVGEQNLYAPRIDSRSSKRSAHMKRRPRLRKIEGSGRFGSDQNTRRKASDG
jgi:hypothetical protein